ncbi:MAG: hypothetical protein KDK54_22505 [Leptospiraceae bacterium]|nr:hypothetical protein [Leptospiraceae bacterium]
MKTNINTFFTILIVSIAFLSFCKPDNNNPENKISNTTKGNLVKTFENNYTEVIKVSLNAGEELSEHEGEVRLIYSLTDSSLEWNENGKNLGTKTWKKGELHFHESGKHSVKNNGSTKAEWLVFARKNETLPKCEELIEKDVNSLEGSFKLQLFENDLFRATEIKLAPNESIPMHEGINRIIYALSDYKILYNSSKEGEIEKAFKTGDTHWHTCEKHSLKNLGNSEAHYLIISFK